MSLKLIVPVLFLVLGCVSQTGPPGVIGVDVFQPPVPPTEKTVFVQPASDVPESAKAFLGVHSGRWWHVRSGDCGLRYFTLFTLYVNEVKVIDGKIKARVVYAEGKSQNRIKKSTWEECFDCPIEQSEDHATLFVSLKKRKKLMKFFFAEGKLQGRNLSDPMIEAMF
jgi:hypothetical protein